jgi:hypothetical protein
MKKHNALSDFRQRSSASRGLFALVRLGGGGLDSENGFAFLHQIEPVARDRFQINRIGLKQIHFTRLFREQRLLFVALCLELVDVGVTDLEFFVRRHEETHDDEADREEKNSDEDTIPTLPNGSCTPRAEI